MPDRETRPIRVVERLKRRKDFRVASGGVRVSSNTFVLQAHRRADEGPPRVGFTVSRQVGNAVERNRVRRRLREVVRLSVAGGGDGDAGSGRELRTGHDYVLVGRRAALAVPFAEIRREFDVVLSRAHKPDHTGTGGTRSGPLHEPGSSSQQPKPRGRRSKASR